MELFIQVRNGQPFEHPIFGDNFRQAFPHIDTDNLPPEFARFVRVEQPSIGVYEVYDGVTYEWTGNAFTDVHHVRAMTDEEKTEMQANVKAIWAEHGDPSWVFNETTCSFAPPENNAEVTQ